MRYVVMHYAYDEQTHERTSRVVIAFDNEAEYHEYISAAAEDLQRRRQAGSADLKERITGAHWPAGYHAQQQRRRLVRRVVAHGATVPDELAEPDYVVRATKP
jgi:hypothetical protein